MKHFNINIEGRDFFVGDLHGMYDLFMAELDRVNFDFGIDRVFSVGDLIDRGPDSVKSLELLNYSWFHAVKGNHEDLMLGSHGLRIWHMNGGRWSDDVDRDDLRILKDLIEDKMHSTLTVDTTHGKVGVVHAESADDWENNGPITKETNRWARTRIKCLQDRPIDNIDIVVVGHTPTKQVLRLGNIIYIDTGACFTEGYLTLLNVEEVFEGEFKRVGL